MDDAEAVARLVEERFPKLDGKVEINYIGTTIGLSLIHILGSVLSGCASCNGAGP